MFPLGTAFVPGDVVSLRLFEPRYVHMMRDILQHDEMTFCSVLIMAGSEVGGGDRRADVGVRVFVDDCAATPEGGYVLVGRATDVVTVESWQPDDPYPRALVNICTSDVVSDRERTTVEGAISQLAQRVRLLLVGRAAIPQSLEIALRTIASGHHWTSQDSSQAEAALWGLVRCVPANAVDRLALLRATGLVQRTNILSRIVDHIAEVADFQRFDA